MVEKLCKFIVWVLGLIVLVAFMTTIVTLLETYAPTLKLLWAILNIAFSTLFGAILMEKILEFDYEEWKENREYKKKWGYK